MLKLNSLFIKKEIISNICFFLFIIILIINMIMTIIIIVTMTVKITIIMTVIMSIMISKIIIMTITMMIIVMPTKIMTIIMIIRIIIINVILIRRKKAGKKISDDNIEPYYMYILFNARLNKACLVITIFYLFFFILYLNNFYLISKLFGKYLLMTVRILLVTSI